MIVAGTVNPTWMGGKETYVKLPCPKQALRIKELEDQLLAAVPSVEIREVEVVKVDENTLAKLHDAQDEMARMRATISNKVVVEPRVVEKIIEVPVDRTTEVIRIKTVTNWKLVLLVSIAALMVGLLSGYVFSELLPRDGRLVPNYTEASPGSRGPQLKKEVSRGTR